MENGFNLRERTALIVGPFTTTVQSLMMGLTQMGSDCVLLDFDNAGSQRFCNQINDAREINPKFGRALSIKSPMKTPEDIKDAVGTAAQSFGSVDLFIDAQVYNKPNRFKIGDPLTHLDDEVLHGFKSSVMLTHAVLNFLKNRKRGRILYLLNESYPDPVMAGARGALVPFAQTLAKQVSEFNITVNCLKLGLTEEFILAQHPEAKSIKEAVEKLKEKEPHLRITEPDKITNTITYLVSQYGAAVNGQVISLT
ncbi:3-ketoacyl-ACP reductase [Bdellovibrio bacteriovorus]|uniref:3-ketoacyl-ACP reductase n=1 Tax=Bdellovibrio bacteriovorus TaxID=959 RepID=A0A161PUV5_BDEBC|nr:SDR family oxidoreductase [Bdellovibrio bacteriovorus]KYG69298.1 3-ketoacyl-ACP reductase [Bdellovibrio bacteriovorus]